MHTAAYGQAVPRWEARWRPLSKKQKDNVLRMTGRRWRGLNSLAAIGVSVRNLFATNRLHFVPVKRFRALGCDQDQLVEPLEPSYEAPVTRS